MTDIGVTDMAIYIPRYYLPHTKLAIMRGIEPEKFNIGLGAYNMSVVPPWEDAVTMAANAGRLLLDKAKMTPDDIQQLVVSTESSVDHSKPVASFVQGLLKIGSRSRVYEIKHACYGGTAGFVASMDRISHSAGSNQKAMVIMTDISKYGFGNPGEPTQGAGAVALLVGKNPKLFSVDASINGIFSKDVFDFWRPTGHRVPIVDGKYSIQCYLMALEGAVSHLRSNLGIKAGELFRFLDHIIYHMPFPKMAYKAHRHLIDIEYENLASGKKDKIFKESFAKMVEPGLLGAKEVGNIYTGSVYMGLVSLMENEKKNVENKKIGIFSYGSGCGAEFMLCNVNRNITNIINGLRFKEQLACRKEITAEQYTQFYSKSAEETLFSSEEARGFKNEFTNFVFTGFKEHKRQYI